jgi:hypothetical protein
MASCEHVMHIKEIRKLAKKKFNNMKGQNMVTKMSESSSLALYRDMNSSWGKKSHVKWCTRKWRNIFTVLQFLHFTYVILYNLFYILAIWFLKL